MYLSSTCQLKNADPDPVFVLRSQNDDISSLSYDQHFKSILSGSSVGTIKFWSTTTHRPIKEFQAGSRSSILHLKIVRYGDNKTSLVTHNRSGEIMIWNIISLKDIELETVWYSSAIGFCPISIVQKDNSNFWVSLPDEKSDICIKDYPNSHSLSLKLNENKGMIMQMIFILENIFALIAGYEDGCIIIWNIHKTSVMCSLKLFDDPIMALCFDSKAMKLLTTSANNSVKMIKIKEDFSKMEMLLVIDTQYKGSSAVKLRNDSKLVFIGGWDGKVRVYQWKNMRLLAVLKYHSETINCLTFDENDRVIVGSKDGKISIWGVYTK